MDGATDNMIVDFFIYDPVSANYVSIAKNLQNNWNIEFSHGAYCYTFQANNKDVHGLSREEAVTYLTSLEGQVQMQVQYEIGIVICTSCYAEETSAGLWRSRLCSCTSARMSHPVAYAVHVSDAGLIVVALISLYHA